jgi:hypothetical protein
VLLGDLRLEDAGLAGDLDGPLGEDVGDLGDGLDLVEELGEVLEAGPLVVGDGDGNVDVDGFDDLRHGSHPLCLRYLRVSRPESPNAIATVRVQAAIPGA